MVYKWWPEDVALAMGADDAFRVMRRRARGVRARVQKSWHAAGPRIGVRLVLFLLISGYKTLTSAVEAASIGPLSFPPPRATVVGSPAPTAQVEPPRGLGLRRSLMGSTTTVVGSHWFPPHWSAFVGSPVPTA